MRVTLDALYQGQPAPPEALASLTEAERAQVASLVRTANVVRISLNQPTPSAEMEAAALARAHQAMASRPGPAIPPLPVDEAVALARAQQAQAKKLAAAAAMPQTDKQDKETDGGNWFTRLFKKP